MHLFSKLHPRSPSLLLLSLVSALVAAPSDAASKASPFVLNRQPDLGNGWFLNPILAGDRPDPSLLKDGSDYYMVHSSFDQCPGLLVWHSRDLVNWSPLAPALTKHVGTIWAPDLCKHGDRYYIYFPVLNASGVTNMVVQANSPRGPWSEPVDLKTGNIDPGHAVDETGHRFLFLSAGHLVPLSDDGLSVTAPPKKVYDGWKYPDTWDVEVFAQEGPKILRHGEYYYMVLAEGGTAGPATSHMVIMARSKSLEGPWENSPYNPVVHTASSRDKWWSRGHATLVEGPDGKQWYLVYHAYENGHYNLGRQTLLEPVEWTPDGWLRASGWDVAKPIPKPAGADQKPVHRKYSDDFEGDNLGSQWSRFCEVTKACAAPVVKDGTLVLEATGSSPKDSAPLCFIPGDYNYEMQVEVDSDPEATAGLLVFYNTRLFAGIGLSSKDLLEYGKGDFCAFPKPQGIGNHYHLRLRLCDNVVTTWYSADGVNWTRHWMQFEVSGYHHNVAGGFYSLRPALLSCGKGKVRFKHFRYTALP